MGNEDVVGQLARARSERQRLAARLDAETAARKLLEAKFAGLLSLTGRLLAELGAARRDLDGTSDAEDRRRSAELHEQLLALAASDDSGDAPRPVRLVASA